MSGKSLASTTSNAASSQQWAVVMSRTSGFVDQAVELDFQVRRV